MNNNVSHAAFAAFFALAMLLSVAPTALAEQQTSYDPDTILIRRTIPDPHAVNRQPLTSDRLSTTSTRYIDARRGLRPYSSVHRCGADHHLYAGYDDHFGISRPEYRPYSYAHRTPRTFVTQFQNSDTSDTASQIQELPVPDARWLLIRSPQDNTEPEPAADMNIRIHNDRSAIPTTTGAVLITADGTVIQVGD